MTGPLTGVRVLELSGLGPGPFAGMLLADLGADVTRVDRPGRTAASPPAADVTGRGKRSVVLDLKTDGGREALLTLAAASDLLIEGNRPGVTERLGVGPDDVWARNPRVVYGRMTGWGQDGPLAHAAGHDVGYVALTGALHAIGPHDGPPQIPLNLLGDFAGGSLYLVVGLLAALHEAARTGRGTVVDAAIVDGASHLLAAIHGLLGAGRWRDERGANLLDGGTPFYAVYETADGGHMAVGALEPQFYAELLRLLEIPVDVVDPAAQHDRATWPRLRATLAAAFASRTREEWTAVFSGTDACVAPVRSLTEAAADPHLAARSSLVVRDGVLQPSPAPRFGGDTAVPGRPPGPGEHTREVLAAAGLDADRLIADGAAG